MYGLRNINYTGFVSTVKSPLVTSRLFSTTQFIKEEQKSKVIDDVVSTLKNNTSSSSASSKTSKFENILDASNLQTKQSRFIFNPLQSSKQAGLRNSNKDWKSTVRGKENNYPAAQLIKKSVEEYHLTGPKAGRTVQVRNGDVNNATRQLNRMLNEAKIAQTTMDQRYYIRPSKQKLLKTVRRKKREFSVAFGDLLRTVQEIKRKGY